MPTSNRHAPTLRILDANRNRSMEGLRVVEEYLRFVLNDSFLMHECKQLRHALQQAFDPFFSTNDLVQCRNTPGDVGTTVDAPEEYCRDHVETIAFANLSRVSQALRALEEYGKLIDPSFARSIESVRYRWYSLEKAVRATWENCRRLEQHSLYILVDGDQSTEALEQRITPLIHSGVDLIQLRDKRLDDRQLLERARCLRRMTQGTSALFIVNDRPDIAVLSQADGVHVGQEETRVQDVRTLVGPSTLIGVSTHTIQQARQAVLDGCDYIGVGPTFASSTKSFSQLAGVDLLRQVAKETRLPAFAIGGIDLGNLDQVLDCGIHRIAVSGAILNSIDPPTAARQLKLQLQHDGSHSYGQENRI